MISFIIVFITAVKIPTLYLRFLPYLTYLEKEQILKIMIGIIPYDKKVRCQSLELTSYFFNKDYRLYRPHSLPSFLTIYQF